MILVFRPCYISFDDGQCVTVTLEKINSDDDGDDEDYNVTVEKTCYTRENQF